MHRVTRNDTCGLAGGGFVWFAASPRDGLLLVAGCVRVPPRHGPGRRSVGGTPRSPLRGPTTMLSQLFRTKNLNDILAAAEQPQTQLRRTLGPLNVTLLGIGAIIGAGIFATVGTAAAGDAARPGAGRSCRFRFASRPSSAPFTALCYAEFASMVPISGSAYTYAYATLGELIAWIIGWDLMIEYAIGNVSVAISWSNYFRTFLHDGFGINVPGWMATDYWTARQIPGCWKALRTCSEFPSRLISWRRQLWPP